MSVKNVRLGEIAKINPRRPELIFSDTDKVTFVPMEAVDDVTGTLARPVERPYAHVKKGYTVFAEKDVIFAKITPCMQNGKHAIARSLISDIGFGSTEFHVIRPGKNVVPEWIHYFLRRKETLDAAIKTFTGTVGQQRVPSKFLEDLLIPLPSIDIQSRITARLKDQLASLDLARQAAEAQLDEIDFLKVKALGNVFNHVEPRRPIGDVAKVQSGFAFKSQEFTKQGIRLLRNTNISPCRVYWDDAAFVQLEEETKYSAYSLHENDILISLDRPIISTGIKVARVESKDLPALLVQRVGRFQLDKDRLDANYLYGFLQTQEFIDAISGHDQSLGVPHISPTQIENIEIPLPSLSEQHRLAFKVQEISQEIDTAKKSLEKQLADISLLPSRLLSEAFPVANDAALS
jgi:type I restriction enzyme, S subunit